MYRMMIAAPSSGTGKTSVTIALLGALKKKGIDVCSFKCGPDYIDPMYHRSVLGVECHNADLFFLSEDGLKKEYARYASGKEACVFEGVMGFYDGIGTTDAAGSAWHVADTLDIPVILVVNPRGASLSVSALIKGFNEFKAPSHVAGVILNQTTRGMCDYLAKQIEETTGVPVFGFLPKVEEAALESRHLGLYTSGEISELSEKLDILSDRFLESVDLDRLLEACKADEVPEAPETVRLSTRATVAVAHDDAFCFIYSETLDLLRDCGADIEYFSPINDTEVPENADAIYLPGGYPELYADRLFLNAKMREDIREKIASGIPTLAECGGFLYLSKYLSDDSDREWEMAGVLPGKAENTGKLVRFGYCTITAKEDGLLFKKGESVKAHEFHYWDSTENGSSFTAVKPSGRSWECGFSTDSLYAGFPHLYLPSAPQAAMRFVDKAEEYRRSKKV